MEAAVIIWKCVWAAIGIAAVLTVAACLIGNLFV